MEDDLEIAECVYRLAERWSWYWDKSEHRTLVATAGGVRQQSQVVDVRRCCACHEEIFGATGVVAHMMLSHGYRMDGRQFNNRNELIGHA